MSDSGEVEAVCEPGAFWGDLARDLQDPEFLAEYVAASEEITRVDARYRRP